MSDALNTGPTESNDKEFIETLKAREGEIVGGVEKCDLSYKKNVEGIDVNLDGGRLNDEAGADGMNDSMLGTEGFERGLRGIGAGILESEGHNDKISLLGAPNG